MKHFEQLSDYFKLRPSNGNGCLPIFLSFVLPLFYVRFTLLHYRMEEGEAINKSQYIYLLTFQWPCPLHNQKNQHRHAHMHARTHTPLLNTNTENLVVCITFAHTHSQMLKMRLHRSASMYECVNARV